MIARILLTLFLIAIGLYCVYGFAATFEPLPPKTQWTWRGLYTLIFLTNAFFLLRLWRSPTT